MNISELRELIKNSDDFAIQYVIEQLEDVGIVSDSDLSLSNVVFHQVSSELLQHIKIKGFSGELNFTCLYLEYVGNVYAIFDSNRYDLYQARDWLINTHLALQ